MDTLSLSTEDFKGTNIEKGILNNNLEKGRKANVGEIRTHGGKKMKKVLKQEKMLNW